MVWGAGEGYKIVILWALIFLRFELLCWWLCIHFLYSLIHFSLVDKFFLWYFYIFPSDHYKKINILAAEKKLPLKDWKLPLKHIWAKINSGGNKQPLFSYDPPLKMCFQGGKIPFIIFGGRINNNSGGFCCRRFVFSAAKTFLKKKLVGHTCSRKPERKGVERHGIGKPVSGHLRSLII